MQNSKYPLIGRDSSSSPFSVELLLCLGSEALIYMRHVQQTAVPGPREGSRRQGDAYYLQSPDNLYS
jgi:hypothetical protein